MFFLSDEIDCVEMLKKMRKVNFVNVILGYLMWVRRHYTVRSLVVFSTVILLHESWCYDLLCF